MLSDIEDEDYNWVQNEREAAYGEFAIEMAHDPDGFNILHYQNSEFMWFCGDKVIDVYKTCFFYDRTDNAIFGIDMSPTSYAFKLFLMVTIFGIKYAVRKGSDDYYDTISFELRTLNQAMSDSDTQSTSTTATTTTEATHASKKIQTIPPTFVDLVLETAFFDINGAYTIVVVTLWGFIVIIVMVCCKHPKYWKSRRLKKIYKIYKQFRTRIRLIQQKIKHFCQNDYRLLNLLYCIKVRAVFALLYIVDWLK